MRAQLGRHRGGLAEAQRRDIQSEQPAKELVGSDVARRRRQGGPNYHGDNHVINANTPLLAAKVAGLKATVGLLLILLIKSQLLRVKMSFLGSVVGLVLTLSFLVTSGALVVISAGAVAWGLQQRRSAAA